MRLHPHCKMVDDGKNSATGIVSLSVDWAGIVQIAWYIPSERHALLELPQPLPFKECTCVGADLVTGRFTHVSGEEPPLPVITRALALAIAVGPARGWIPRLAGLRASLNVLRTPSTVAE